MTAAVLSSHRPASKKTTLKWTMPQSINTVKQGHIHKRTGSSGSHHMTASKKLATSAPANKVEKLESEITFTFETVANVSVMLESLRNAYATCKSEIDQSKYATRLSEKEKELLAAYDELNLQVSHLERQVNKFETRLEDLKSLSQESQQQSLQPQQPQTAASPASVDSAMETRTPQLSYPQYDLSTTTSFLANYLFDYYPPLCYEMPQCQQPQYQQHPQVSLTPEQSFVPYIDVNTVPYTSYPTATCNYNYASSALNVQYPFYAPS